MSRIPTVLFVCVHNAGRSQMAQGWLAHYAEGRVDVRSAGSEPADQLNPVAVEVMAEVGIDITDQHPKILTVDTVCACDVIITMGCGDMCPVFTGKRYEDWDLPDPAGQGVDAVRLIRDDIRARVEALVRELLPGAAATTAESGAPTVRIAPMTSAHADPVLAIYQAGIETGNATFETTAPTWDDFDRTRLTDHRFVAVDDDGAVVGWIACVAVSDRCTYAGVVEHSVYVRPDHRSGGIGRDLLAALVRSTEAAGVWTIQSGVFAENAASLALHAAAGFRVVGIRERLGRHHGNWRDVTLIERRSRVV